jgi:Zn finger protein HypA/HybF involved in hydrogenase expression
MMKNIKRNSDKQRGDHMTRIKYRWPIVVVAALALTGVMSQSIRGAEEPESSYTGAKKCKMCHKSEKSGGQFLLWESSSHAKAFEVLASEEAVAAAEKLDLGDPQKAAECLQCHSTAFAVIEEMDDHKITLEEGVSCESCHGAASRYVGMKTMKGITAGEIEAASVGLLKPTEKTCRTCHRPEGNPFHKEFDFEKAAKMIAHPIPE